MTKAAGGLGPGNQDVTFEIAFIEGAKAADGYVEADVTSPELDSLLHPSGVCRVHVLTRVQKSKKGARFSVDAFQIASLHDYLRRQKPVRERLEREFNHMRSTVKNLDEKFRAGELWEHGKVLFLELGRRQLADTEGIAALQKFIPKLPVAHITARADMPDTHARFRVVLQAWGDEHWFFADFRDGELVGMDME